jgi:hypothetical protein
MDKVLIYPEKFVKCNKKSLPIMLYDDHSL